MSELTGTYAKLAEAIEMGEEDDARALAQQAVDEGNEPADIIKTSMSEGVKRAGARFNDGEFFLPELMLTGESMKAGLSVVMPIILEQMKDSPVESKGKIMMGTVEGDVHDIGKNICLAMLQAQGFDVIDLGVDNDEDWIIQQIKEQKPNVIGLGSYMTTTMINIPPVFARIRKEGLDKELNLKLLAGGVALNRRWALEVAKADNYADDAWEFIDMLHEELGIVNEDKKASEYGKGGNVKIR